MQYFRKILCLAIMSLSCVLSDEVIHTVDMQATCSGSYNTNESLSSVTLDNQTYVLLKHKAWIWTSKVVNTTKEIQANFQDNATLECVTILYYNDVYIPDIFVTFLDTSNLTQTVVTRTLEQKWLDPRDVLVENIKVHAYLLSDVYLSTPSEITGTDTLHTVGQITRNVPGYAAFLSDLILDSLKQCVRKTVGPTHTSLCRT